MEPGHMTLFLMNERAGMSGLNGAGSLISGGGFTLTRMGKTSPGRSVVFYRCCSFYEACLKG
jgi:hypothetical protein